MGDALDLDDLDAALEGLSNKPGTPAGQAPVAQADAPTSVSEAPFAVPQAGPPPLVPGQPAVPPRAAPPPLTPPPVRAKKPAAPSPTAPTQWNGRTPFDDLFVSDTTPTPSARGGL